MNSDKIRQKFIDFFKEAPRSHVEISPSPLVLENDPTTLFTSSGMQQLVPYLMGKPHEKGKRLVDSQPCLRTVDIDEVGDTTHLTFFEMLGNWSLGDYFKKEQLAWCWEFFTKELGLPSEKLFVSVFEGTRNVPMDEESVAVWKKIGVPENRIFYYGVEKNWWSRSGTPDKMPPGEIGGPDSEVFYDFGEELGLHQKLSDKVGPCHPNCGCGRFMEIGNSVFIQYEKKKDGSLSELPQKNVDFGGGLERISAAVEWNPDVFRVDIYWPIIETLEEDTKIKYGSSEERDISFRIISDHIRSAVALVSEGVYPSNKLQGYVLRRLMRRAALKMRKFTTSHGIVELSKKLTNSVTKDIQTQIVVSEEVDKFEIILNKGVLLVSKNPSTKPFDLYQTYGLPYEITEEIYAGLGRKLNEGDRKEYEIHLQKHQELSRTASVGMFKGGLADTSKEVTKLHTATHLLHAALRKVLGEHVSQKGSNITAERLRFDFSHQQKLTEEEIKEVEDLVNEQIKKDLPISYEEKTLEEALKEGALAFFGEKYGDKVRVHTIGGAEDFFSREVCGGPHVSHTREVGRVKIIKQEKVGADVVRVYATVV